MLGPSAYRAAILGCGRIAHYHALGYQTAGVPVVACADVEPQAIEKLTTAFPISRSYTTFEELLERERPDIVSVCTPPPIHREMVEAAVAAGVRAIICEKPMATDLATADAMIDVCERSSVIFIVNHQRRFQGEYMQAVRWLKQGRIGGVEHVVTGVRGDLLHDGTHAIDLLRFYLDDRPVTRVLGAIERDGTNAYGRRIETMPPGYRYGHPVESTALAELVFGDGIRAVLEVGHKVARPSQGYGPVARIYGSDGIIEINTPGCGSGRGVRVTTFGKQPTPDPQVGSEVHGAWELVACDEEMGPLPICRSIEAMLECLRHGTNDHPLRARSARADLEIIMAIFESVRRRVVIELPVAFGHSPLEQMISDGAL